MLCIYVKPIGFSGLADTVQAADEETRLGVSEKSQFLLPTVNGRIAFSATLLEMVHLPYVNII